MPSFSLSRSFLSASYHQFKLFIQPIIHSSIFRQSGHPFLLRRLPQRSTVTTPTQPPCNSGHTCPKTTTRQPDRRQTDRRQPIDNPLTTDSPITWMKWRNVSWFHSFIHHLFIAFFSTCIHKFVDSSTTFIYPIVNSSLSSTIASFLIDSFNHSTIRLLIQPSISSINLLIRPFIPFNQLIYSSRRSETRSWRLHLLQRVSWQGFIV